MRVLFQISDYISSFEGPIALTLGNFDGIHLGHQAIFQRMQEVAKERVLITFSNHPGEILRGSSPSRLLNLNYKLELLSESRLSCVLLLPFTQELSLKTAEEFLKEIHSHIPFTHLILGYDAHLGHQRKGSQEVLSILGKEMGFFLEYIDPVLIEDIPVSSSRIRAAIQAGDLKSAEKLLGRPFAISGDVIRGKGYGQKIGFPTANVDITGLTLPPFGVYSISATFKDLTFQGIANLGVAPTFSHNECRPLLEIHLFKSNLPIPLYGDKIKVIFKSFLRKEQKFENIKSLKRQISLDISSIKKELTI